MWADVNSCPAETLEKHERLLALRRVIAEKFPTESHKPGGIFPTGLEGIDRVEGGLRRAALTEFSGSSACGSLLLHALLRQLPQTTGFAALIDATHCFEVESALPQLLWVLCADAMQAIKATDLILRDGNLSLLMLDLQLTPAPQLRRIPSSTWHRFQRLAEQSTMAVLILTPQPLVEGAQVRITSHAAWSLHDQRRWRADLISEIPWRVFPRRAFDRHDGPAFPQSIHA